MAYRSVYVPEVGEVLISKRRGARYIRLSVTATGKIRVGMPLWTPYAAGVSFAKQRKDWIRQQLDAHPKTVLLEGVQVGKAHRLRFHPRRGGTAVSTRVTTNTVDIYTDLPPDHGDVQSKALAASERALIKEATTLLPQRLSTLAARHGYSYSQVKVRKLTSRWGSCSSAKVINLSYYLIQLPWPMIDYVLMHELVHTRHLNHGKSFWSDLNKALPDAPDLRKQIKAYNPKVEVF